MEFLVGFPSPFALRFIEKKTLPFGLPCDTQQFQSLEVSLRKLPPSEKYVYTETFPQKKGEFVKISSLQKTPIRFSRGELCLNCRGVIIPQNPHPRESS